MVIIVDELLSLNRPAILPEASNRIASILLATIGAYTFALTEEEEITILNTIVEDISMGRLLIALHDRYRMQFGEVTTCPSTKPAIIGFSLLIRYASKDLQKLLTKYSNSKTKDTLMSV